MSATAIEWMNRLVGPGPGPCTATACCGSDCGYRAPQADTVAAGKPLVANATRSALQPTRAHVVEGVELPDIVRVSTASERGCGDGRRPICLRTLSGRATAVAPSARTGKFQELSPSPTGAHLES